MSKHTPELRDNIGLTPQQYHAGLDKLWVALEITTVQTDDVFTLAGVSIAELRTQRDDLLAACKAISQALQPSIFDDQGRCQTWLAEFNDDARVKFQTIIAKAEEGTT